MLHFVTGNPIKFSEVKAIFPDLEQVVIDLPEIQDIDAKNIIRAKLIEALRHIPGEVIVEDTSLSLECLHGLPGPLIKWFLKTVGTTGLVEITEKFGNNRAEAKTTIGYARNRNEMYFFEGVIRGNVVPARGDRNFGWEALFQPEGTTKTYGELTAQEKSEISMRALAARQCKHFIEKMKKVE